MRLIHTHTSESGLYYDAQTRPRYVALSYTWSPDLAPEFRTPGSTAKPSPLVSGACKAARELGYDYIWIHGACVDPSSTAEVSEAVNSAFAWFREAALCLVYLADLRPAETPGDDPHDEETWKHCRWFSRSWTLPELLAPPDLRFYDSRWAFRGSKSSLLRLVSRITYVAEDVLRDAGLIPEVGVGKRMSWASARSATRAEDPAYALLGVFGVSMPVIYGEGRRAFVRLQEEIVKDGGDTSLFIWDQPKSGDPRPLRGLFANSPAEFSRFVACPPQWAKPLRFEGEMRPTGGGLSIRGNFFPYPGACTHRLLLDLGHHEGSPQKRAALVLVRVRDTFVRPASNAVVATTTAESSSTPWSLTARRDLDPKTSLLLDKACRSSPAPRGPGGAAPCSHAAGLAARPMARPTMSPSRRRGSQQDAATTLYDPAAAAPSESFALSCGGSSLASRRPKKRASDPTAPDDGGDKRARLNTFTPDASIISAASEQGTRTVSDDDDAGDDGSTTSEEDPSFFEPNMHEPPPALPEGHAFLAVLDELSEVARAAFLRHCGLQLSAAPHRPPPTRFLACHFWKRDPARHRACLAGCQLSTPGDAKRHAWLHHRLPHYCPVCYELFPAASARAAHIVRRACDLRPRPRVEGVSEDQKLRLARKDRASASPAEAWFAIWDVLFGEGGGGQAARPATPYLDGEEGGARVALVREFWDESGQAVVSSFLMERRMLAWGMRDEERSLAALHALVLGRLVEEELGGEEEGWEMVAAAGATTPPVLAEEPAAMGARADCPAPGPRDPVSHRGAPSWARRAAAPPGAAAYNPRCHPYGAGRGSGPGPGPSTL